PWDDPGRNWRWPHSLFCLAPRWSGDMLLRDENLPSRPPVQTVIASVKSYGGIANGETSLDPAAGGVIDCPHSCNAGTSTRGLKRGGVRTRGARSSSGSATTGLRPAEAVAGSVRQDVQEER